MIVCLLRQFERLVEYMVIVCLIRQFEGLLEFLPGTEGYYLLYILSKLFFETGG